MQLTHDAAELDALFGYVRPRHDVTARKIARAQRMMLSTTITVIPGCRSYQGRNARLASDVMPNDEGSRGFCWR